MVKHDDRFIFLKAGRKWHLDWTLFRFLFFFHFFWSSCCEYFFKAGDKWLWKCSDPLEHKLTLTFWVYFLRIWWIITMCAMWVWVRMNQAPPFLFVCGSLLSSLKTSDPNLCVHVCVCLGSRHVSLILNTFCGGLVVLPRLADSCRVWLAEACCSCVYRQQLFGIKKPKQNRGAEGREREV